MIYWIKPEDNVSVLENSPGRTGRMYDLIKTKKGTISFPFLFYKLVPELQER